jgi:hypothetical protein
MLRCRVARGKFVLRVVLVAQMSFESICPGGSLEFSPVVARWKAFVV